MAKIYVNPVVEVEAIDVEYGIAASSTSERLIQLDEIQWEEES